MPSGCVLNREEWQAITDFCKEADCYLLYDSAMERILFDGLSVIHPASLPGMREKVITVGAASKEYRMIGWRVGWVLGPAQVIADVARVSISNVVCQTGIAMGAVAKAIRAKDDGIKACTQIWEERRNVILAELRDFQTIKPHGGWSLWVDVSDLGMDGPTASKRLLEKAKVAATPMVNWGTDRSANYVRLVYSNEPVERLRGLKELFDKALSLTRSIFRPS